MAHQQKVNQNNSTMYKLFVTSFIALMTISSMSAQNYGHIIPLKYEHFVGKEAWMGYGVSVSPIDRSALKENLQNDERVIVFYENVDGSIVLVLHGTDDMRSTVYQEWMLSTDKVETLRKYLRPYNDDTSGFNMWFCKSHIVVSDSGYEDSVPSYLSADAAKYGTVYTKSGGAVWLKFSPSIASDLDAVIDVLHTLYGSE